MQFENAIRFVKAGLENEDAIKSLVQLEGEELYNALRFTYEQNGNVNVSELQNDNGIVMFSSAEPITAKGETVRTYNYYRHKIEVKTNREGKTIEIASIKPSGNSSYEIITYALKDYPEDFDILEAIKNGTVDQKIKEMNLPQGNKTSNVVVNNDGSISYNENHSRNGSNIQRNYTQQTDSNGNTTKTHYTYRITGQDGSQLLSLDRSWQKNPNGTTTTVINGKTYTASFNDSTSEIKIIQDDGTETTISIGKLVADESSYSSDMLSDLKNKFGSLKDANRAFFEHCKTMPADMLLTISENISRIFITKEEFSAIKDTFLNTGLNLATTAHELGHSVDFRGITEVNHKVHMGAIATNQDLIKIYEKEILQFKKDYPELAQEAIDYFSQTGGITDTGLNEFVAEVNMLMTTSETNSPKLQTRSQYLVRYFPQTVAKIGELNVNEYVKQNPAYESSSSVEQNS